STHGGIAVPDSAGGAIVCSVEDRGSGSDLYAQHVSAAGAVDWGSGGTAICTAAGSQTLAGAIPDGARGVLVTWHDLRSGDYDVYVQRLGATGSVASGWTVNGVAVCTATGSQIF